MVSQFYYLSPIGVLKICSTKSHITHLFLQAEAGENVNVNVLPQVLSDCIQQLDDYFLGKRKEFQLPLAPQGTLFQQQVWEALQTIPYGTTISYKELAKRVNNPKACRAVGTANGHNPIPIIIPCHRVIAADGGLGGYSGGLSNKRFLLQLEKLL